MGIKATIEPRKVQNHGKDRWRVIVPMDLRRASGKRMFFFKEEADAVEKCEQLMSDRRRVSEGFHRLSEQGQALVLEALDRVHGDPWKLLVAIENMSKTEKLTKSRTVDEVVEECLKSKRDKEVRNRSYISTKSALKQFKDSKEIKGKMIHEITSSMIAKWVNGNKWSAGTRIAYITYVRTLFYFAVRNDYISKNPARGVEKPMREERGTGIHSVDQVKALLGTALKHDPGILGYICPLYFGGHRPRGASEIEEKDVTAKTILVPGKKNKGRQHRFIKINPTLATWLKVGGIEFGPTNLRARMERIRRLAGNPPWPHDVLRHTFCSYAMPKYGAKKTAEMAGHKEDVLTSRYYEPVDPNEVKAFWALTPKSISNLG